MTVLARLAMSAGAPVKGVFRPDSARTKAVGDALVVSSNASAAGDLSLPSMNEAAARFPVNDRAAGIMKADPVSTAAIVSDAHAQSDDGGDQLIQAFENSNAGSDAERSWTARLRSLLASMTGQFGSWLKYEDAKPVQISAANALLMITQTARSGADGTVTEIRAASPDDLSKGVRRLADPAVWDMLSGGAALIDARTMDLVPVPGQPLRFVEVTDQSVGNYRRIAAAWLSDNFRTYVVLVIALVGIFSAWLGKVVQKKGVRTAK
jgi:hypothetical protein